MGETLLNTVWVGTFKASKLDTEQMHASVLLKAEEAGLGDLVSNVSSSSNGLYQFMIAPCGGKRGWPNSIAWEELVAFTARKCAGTDFIIKRAYIAET